MLERALTGAGHDSHTGRHETDLIGPVEHIHTDLFNVTQTSEDIETEPLISLL